MRRAFARPAHIRIFRRQDAAPSAALDEALVLRHAAKAILARRPELVIAWHPNDGSKAPLQNFPSKFHMLFGLADIARYDEPVVVVTADALEAYAVCGTPNV